MADIVERLQDDRAAFRGGSGAAQFAAETIRDLRAAIEERDRRIAELEGENAWQPIETAPKDGVDIMAWPQPISRQPFVAFWDEARGGQWSQWPGRDRANPTHWRPLPTPPQEIATTEGSGHG